MRVPLGDEESRWISPEHPHSQSQPRFQPRPVSGRVQGRLDYGQFRDEKTGERSDTESFTVDTEVPSTHTLSRICLWYREVHIPPHFRPTFSQRSTLKEVFFSSLTGLPGPPDLFVPTEEWHTCEVEKNGVGEQIPQNEPRHTTTILRRGHDGVPGLRNQDTPTHSLRPVRGRQEGREVQLSLQDWDDLDPGGTTPLPPSRRDDYLHVLVVPPDTSTLRTLESHFRG